MSRKPIETDDTTRDEQIDQRLGIGPLDLRALGLLEEGDALNLTGLLCHLLVLKDPKGRTWAQRMVEGWILDALEGDPRAIEDILDRIEKGQPTGAPAVTTPPHIDDGTASKILEVLCDRGKHATSA